MMGKTIEERAREALAHAGDDVPDFAAEILRRPSREELEALLTDLSARAGMAGQEADTEEAAAERTTGYMRHPHDVKQAHAEGREAGLTDAIKALRALLDRRAP